MCTKLMVLLWLAILCVHVETRHNRNTRCDSLKHTDPGPCNTAYAHVPMYTYNDQTGQCEEFTYYGGCLGCDSLKHTDPGPCNTAYRAHVPMYTYNHQTGRCEEFTYGGCLGNSNKFSTLDMCEWICGDHADLDKVREAFLNSENKI